MCAGDWAVQCAGAAGGCGIAPQRAYAVTGQGDRQTASIRREHALSRYAATVVMNLSLPQIRNRAPAGMYHSLALLWYRIQLFADARVPMLRHSSLSSLSLYLSPSASHIILLVRTHALAVPHPLFGMNELPGQPFAPQCQLSMNAKIA